MAGIEKARTDLARFERDDRPAFERWMSATFGQVLTELREIEARFMEKSALAQEIEMELVFGTCRSHHEAYCVVMLRRERAANGTPPEPEDEDAGTGAAGPEENGSGNAGELDELTMAEMFEDFVAQVLGMNPDRIKGREYDAMFAEFKRTVFGNAGGGKPYESSPPSVDASGPASRAARVKELYRLLVRRLHPDTRADGDATVAEVWHEVQAAYANGDVERLETLLAFADVREKRIGPHTTLAQMRAVMAELKRTLNALRRSLGQARKAPAWNFAGSADRAGLERKTRVELARDLARRRADLDELERVLESWTRTPIRRRAAKRGQPGRGQDEFAF